MIYDYHIDDHHVTINYIVTILSSSRLRVLLTEPLFSIEK